MPEHKGKGTGEEQAVFQPDVENRKEQRSDKLIRELNAERAADGFVTIKGRVSRQYFDERIYGTTDKKEVV